MRTKQLISMMDNFKVSVATAIIAAIVVAIIFITTSDISSGSAFFLAKNRIDSDKDGLPDAFEKQIGTDPTKWDSDSDGHCDSIEIQKVTTPLDKISKPMCCGNGGPGYCVRLRDEFLANYLKQKQQLQSSPQPKA